MYPHLGVLKCANQKLLSFKPILSRVFLCEVVNSVVYICAADFFVVINLVTNSVEKELTD